MIEVRRQTEVFNPYHRCFEPRQEPPAHYLATCTASAATLAPVIRGHWTIENRLHHVLDVREGRKRVESGDESIRNSLFSIPTGLRLYHDRISLEPSPNEAVSINASHIKFQTGPRLLPIPIRHRQLLIAGHRMRITHPMHFGVRHESLFSSN